MINVSENLKSLISEDSRTFRVRLVNDLNTYENIRSFRKSIMFPSSSLSIGNALSACIECTATDVPVSITGEKIKAEITVLGCEEQILLGTFKAEKPTVKDGDVSFVAYDAMKTAAEKTYKSTLDEGEHTAQEYFTDICTVLGESCEALDEADGALVIAEDKLSGYSCRDALAYLAGYLGKNCIVNPEGLFEMIGFAAVDYDLFNEDRIAEPEFADNFCCIGYINCCIDNETTLQSGTGSNGFELISPIMTQERLDAVGQTVFGEASVIKEYKPCKVVQLLGDPRIEVCDVLDLSYGGEVYKVPVMAVTLEYDGGLMATAESYAPSEPQSTSLGERMTFAQKQAQKENDAHISGIVEFSQLIQAAYGVKSTTVDGITYFHDKEALAESTFIFCITSEGFAQASGENCWGGSHKDTVWKYGLSKDGTAVLDMLNVFKITASLIRAGRLESNDGSAYFDLDEGVVGIDKKKSETTTDESGEEVTELKDLYEAQFRFHGLDVAVDKSASDGFCKLSELEEKFLGISLERLGIKKGTFMHTVLHPILSFWLSEQKTGNIGVNVLGVDADGILHHSHMSDTKAVFCQSVFDKENNTFSTKKTSFGNGSVESNIPMTFKAPELYFEGNFIPRVLPKTDENGNKTSFDNVFENGEYIGEVGCGDGTTAHYDGCPTVENATFRLIVSEIGTVKQKKHRLELCNKEKPSVYERFYYGSAWGPWIDVGVYKNTIKKLRKTYTESTNGNGNMNTSIDDAKYVILSISAADSSGGTNYLCNLYRSTATGGRWYANITSVTTKENQANKTFTLTIDYAEI